MSSFQTSGWFALQVVPQHERTVSSLLQYKGYELFSPTYPDRSQWADRKKIVQRPLFPGYVFCRQNESAVGLIRTTPGVIRIVCFGGQPAFVPDSEIEAISRALGSELRVTPYGSCLKVGQLVEVIAGPLRGISGRLVTIRRNARLILSIELTMQAISVEIDPCDVRVVGSMGAQTATALRDRSIGLSREIR